MPHILPTELVRNCTEGLLMCTSRWAYDVTGGWWFTALLLGFLVVLFIATQRYGTTRAFGFSSFVGMLAAISFAVMELMHWGIASLFIIVGIIGLAVMLIGNR